MGIIFDVILAVSDTVGEHFILSWDLADPDNAFQGDGTRRSDADCVREELGIINMPEVLGAEELDIGVYAIRASLSYYWSRATTDNPAECESEIDVIETRPLWTGDVSDVTKLLNERKAV